MSPRRRILFKLTPLLDLLLIMIFAYQIRSSQLAAETARLADEEHEAARNEAEFRQRVEADARDLRERNGRMTRELRELREQLETTRERVRSLAGVLHRVTREISEEEFARMLSATDTKTIGDIEETVERLRAQGPTAVLRELTRFQAVRKHVTLWSVHLPGEERVQISVDGDRVRELTVPGRPALARNALGLALRELEEPKDLVIIFFSWDRVLKSWKDRMEETLHHLAEETLRTRYPAKRFHVSLEGYVGEER